MDATGNRLYDGYLPKVGETGNGQFQVGQRNCPFVKGAVEWAQENGLMVGDANGDLMLRSPLTREQFCVMLKRYHDKFSK